MIGIDSNSQAFPFYPDRTINDLTENKNQSTTKKNDYTKNVQKDKKEEYSHAKQEIAEQINEE